METDTPQMLDGLSLPSKLAVLHNRQLSPHTRPLKTRGRAAGRTRPRQSCAFCLLQDMIYRCHEHSPLMCATQDWPVRVPRPPPAVQLRRAAGQRESEQSWASLGRTPAMEQ